MPATITVVSALWLIPQGRFVPALLILGFFIAAGVSISLLGFNSPMPVLYLLIGVAFGFVLEISGFGNSRKLAAQFYFKDMTVLKVMFTAIIVACTLVFLSSAMGLLDYNLVWVPPTYLWPGIVGGLIMGVGFIVGGFCPGTSLVAMATYCSAASDHRSAASCSRPSACAPRASHRSQVSA